MYNATILPGPWAFLTSAYILGLVVVAVLIHRIHHIVVPRHRLASPRVRLALRLPSLFFLAKSLVLWTAVLAQTTNYDVPWADRDTPSLCWLTFCAACGALCVEALSRAIEGAATTPSPFNLFGYAFLLHIYSSPMTHATKLQGLPARPDRHVVVTILLPLVQLTMIHCLGARQAWSNHRLIPSAFVSILALTHFHWVLWFTDATYPLLNYMPCVFESILLSVTSLAIFLNAFTQIVAEGTLSRPLFGHHDALLPRLDEDFSIALLRMGTASLETSSIAGLGNEVTGIALPLEPTVELSRSGLSLSHLENCERKGFTNEIKQVAATVQDGDFWLDLAWFHEFITFSIGVARFLKHVYTLVRGFLTGPTPDMDIPDDLSQSDRQDAYERFIRGEQVTDDECDEYAPASRSRSSSVTSLLSVSDNAESTLYDDQAETVGLYTDLASVDPASTPTSHLLAHLTDPVASPLTRQRFHQLMSSQDSWVEVMDARRSAPKRPDVTDDGRRNCVVCTVEPRQIICWPCRCLALCDDCRDNLASRTPVSKHTCPCCRTSVQGYSKIYIP